MFEFVGPGSMWSSLTLVHRGRLRWLSGVLATALASMGTFVPRTLGAQTANPQEISSHEVEPTFKLKAERNLVMVHVEVRDAKGRSVDNLRQDDFRVYDQGKVQAILHFSLEKPGIEATEPLAQKPAEKEAAPDAEGRTGTAMPVATPRRFMAMFFDDVNTPMEDMARARDAAGHFLTSSVQPGDRVALYTSSGQKQQDFTDNLAQVHQALLELRPHPIVGGPSNSCVTIPPYEAHLIIDQRDMVAIGVATEEMLNCHFNGERSFINAAQALMDSQATLSIWHAQTQALAALQGIKGLVHRMTSLPGQRSIVIVSGGFLTDTLGVELEEIVDRALHAGVTLNALDARGLYAKTPITNGAQGPVAATGNSTVIGQKLQMLLESTQRQTDGMQFLAFDTGGGFFSNSNDLDAGFRQAADLPETYYLLAFSPQNLKLDGALHPILVKLVAARGLSVQARRGYYAPRKSNDPSAQEKEEIQEAVFSPGETHELPIDVQTQFFLKSEADARIAVQTSLDVRRLRLRKEGDRNLDNLTFVTVVFDRDGHVVSGQQRLVELRLRDSSLESLVQTGITIRTLFNVRPGNYLVRAVVRDSESGQISGLNRTVEIPY